MITNSDIGLAIALAAAIVLFLVLRQLNNATSKQEKLRLLEKYQVLRKKSIKIQEIISSYMLSCDAEKELITDGITYAQYYRSLKFNHISYLSSKYLQKLQNSQNPLLFKKTAGILDHQEVKLKEAENLVSSVLNNDTLAT
jgi:hypothetical protein